MSDMDPVTVTFFWLSIGLLIIGLIGQWLDGD